MMPKFLLYIMALTVSILLFSAFNFFPTDCQTSANGSGSCTTAGFSIPDDPEITDDCHWKGLPLYGKIKFVESFPDIKIKFVESFPDIKVKFVSSFPDKCGEWQVVESFPDIKVKVVESFPDIKVKIVESFPGVEN